MDLVIRNATIAGHTGVRDIGIRDGRITELSQRVEVKGDQEVDADGNLVAPGFVDVHMSDNTQDAWQPFGNGDMLLLALFVSRLSSWRSDLELDNVMAMGSLGAAQSIGKTGQYGIVVGKKADMVILDARLGHEAIVNQSRKLWVLKNGAIVARDGELLAPPA